MTLLDASAVLALLLDEPAAAEVERLLPAARLTAVGVAEVIDQLVRVGGQALPEVVLDLEELGLLDVEPLSALVATTAGALRAAHYHRTRRPVSLADCVVAATAAAGAAAVATSDPHLLELCRDERIDRVPLPDSGGRRWQPDDP
jgi:PIN domain nuclease of toxin-antitoxin system